MIFCLTFQRTHLQTDDSCDAHGRQVSRVERLHLHSDLEHVDRNLFSLKMWDRNVENYSKHLSSRGRTCLKQSSGAGSPPFSAKYSFQSKMPKNKMFLHVGLIQRCIIFSQFRRSAQTFAASKRGGSDAVLLIGYATSSSSAPPE